MKDRVLYADTSLSNPLIPVGPRSVDGTYTIPGVKIPFVWNGAGITLFSPSQGEVSNREVSSNCVRNGDRSSSIQLGFPYSSPLTSP